MYMCLHIQTFRTSEILLVCSNIFVLRYFLQDFRVLSIIIIIIGPSFFIKKMRVAGRKI